MQLPHGDSSTKVFGPPGSCTCGGGCPNVVPIVVLRERQGTGLLLPWAAVGEVPREAAEMAAVEVEAFLGYLCTVVDVAAAVAAAVAASYVASLLPSPRPPPCPPRRLTDRLAASVQDPPGVCPIPACPRPPCSRCSCALSSTAQKSSRISRK